MRYPGNAVEDEVEDGEDEYEAEKAQLLQARLMFNTLRERAARATETDSVLGGIYSRSSM